MKKGNGGRITSLTLEEKGDGKEGGDGSGCDGQHCGSGSGETRRAGGGGPANRRAEESSQSAAGGGGSSHCARGSCRRRLYPAAMAAAEAAPFRSQAAAPRLLPIRRGHGNPATAVSLGVLSPVRRTGAAPLRPSPQLSGRSGSVRAVPLARSPVNGSGPCSSSLPSFLCHSARAAEAEAEAEAAQARIRPGRGLLCVRRAVCAAALALPPPPPPSYSWSASFLPHPASHRPAPSRLRKRRLEIARRARARQLRLGCRTLKRNESQTPLAGGSSRKKPIVLKSQ
ncbi:uncharacterized protein LOC115072007 [Nannospalax galili]|uniref:uncharacterized protein LOC115072007 n=1 Tax=Nannospalax galili TaxID=1026970 RepID=UPI00111BCFAE|nr:uncharacterized protein LOC115072007 [Nannospalax galili]